MWEVLGFKESPYNCAPLGVNSSDAELLVGRDEDGIKFCTVLESSNNGISIISGKPGVGKTSFLNVQQYLLESGNSICGPNLVACRYLSPVNPTDNIKDIALRVVFNLYKSVQEFCSIYDFKPTKNLNKIGKWISNRGSSGFEFGIDIAGFGGSLARNVELPNIADVTFEGIVDVISFMVSEVVNNYNRPGVVICLDNMENLEDDKLSDMLISFRDTLFSIPCVWWVLIGQSGLGSLIQSLDPRVFQRITGTALELNPISKIEFHTAIEQRVKKFHSKGKGKKNIGAPLSKDVHDFLFDSAKGQIRFVFKYSNDICTRWVSRIRMQVIGSRKRSGETDPDRKFLDRLIGEFLVENQIEKNDAFSILKEKVDLEFRNLNLNAKELDILKLIGDKAKVRPKDHKEFGIRSIQQFSSQYLTKLHKQNLLSREQQGQAVLYSLSGLSLLAHSYSLI